MYKIVSNNVIMKFPLYLKQDFDIDKDEVKFAFKLVITKKRKGTVG